MFSIVQLDHIVLRTTQADELVRFYCDVLGMRIERRLEIGLIQLRAGPALIDVVPHDSQLGRESGGEPVPNGRNLAHFCLRIDPFDEQALRAHFSQHDLTMPVPIERYGADGFGLSVYIDDPDGNAVELKGPPLRPPLPTNQRESV